MFKKVIFSAIALCFVTPANPEAAEYFKINAIDSNWSYVLQSFLTHGRPEQKEHFLTGMLTLFVFQRDNFFRKLLSANASKSLTAFYSFLSSSIFIRLLNDGLSKNTLLNAPKDFLLSLNITHKNNKWINALNGLKFLYLANKIQILMSDIENECAELEIESGHSTGGVTQDPNNLILPSTGFLISSAMSWFAEPINPLINIKVPCIPFIRDNQTVLIPVNLLRIICFAAKTFFLLKKNFIPFSTIQKLSPELQERCYEVRMETLSLCNIFSMYPMTPIEFGSQE